MIRKSADDWFADYGESHQNLINEIIHWVCVPIIFASVLGLIRSIPVAESWRLSFRWFDWGLVAVTFVWFFYFYLSPALSVGMLAFIGLCHLALTVIEIAIPRPLWQICAVGFVIAWIGQFIGHLIEGKRPSFLKDLSFLLIGPAWLMSRLYKKLGQSY